MSSDVFSSAGAAPAAPTAQIIKLGELQDSAGGRPLAAAGNPLHAVKTRLEVCIGSGEMSVGELLAAQEGQVLVLDAGVSDAIELRLEGQVVARGQLVAVDGRFALRVTELPVALKV